MEGSKEKQVEELVKGGKYEFSKHAEREREADRGLPETEGIRNGKDLSQMLFLRR